jgi:hypothetical protein
MSDPSPAAGTPAPTNERTPSDRLEPLTEGDYPDENSLVDPLAVRYDCVLIPEGTDYTDLDYAQRRAVLLRRIETAGHPRALRQNYGEMKDEFGVAKSTIHRDMTILSEWVAGHLERNHVGILDAVFRGAVEKLAKEGELREATEVGKEWFDWLAQMGVIDRVPDRLDLNATIHSNPDEGGDYKIIPDDEAGAVEAEPTATEADFEEVEES